MKSSRTIVILSALAHVLAWGAYVPIVIGLVLWPAFQGEVGIEWKVLVTVFVPVSLTGLGFLTIISNLRRTEGKSVSSTLVVLLTIFCALGIFAVSQIHLPLGIRLLLGVAIGSFSIILITDIGDAGSVFFLLLASLLSLGFCALGMFSVGIFFTPSALTLLASAIIFALRSRPAMSQISGG